jgi:hypothetical protein
MSTRLRNRVPANENVGSKTNKRAATGLRDITNKTPKITSKLTIAHKPAPIALAPAPKLLQPIDIRTPELKRNKGNSKKSAVRTVLRPLESTESHVSPKLDKVNQDLPDEIEYCPPPFEQNHNFIPEDDLVCNFVALASSSFMALPLDKISVHEDELEDVSALLDDYLSVEQEDWPDFGPVDGADLFGDVQEEVDVDIFVF